ncbi:gamma-glutamylcyclotransferase [Acidovorax cattleyae]|nr:gamma-glutamylcyclotransferase [Paracidovorax cattleyae]MBF9264738.1 gamma-glutamylcyclotransferase [Paracidovorax cattleyae]
MNSPEEAERLFSYGTLQLEAVQLSTFGRRLVGHADRLPGFRLEQLEIRDAAVVAASGKTHHPILVRTDDRTVAFVEGTVFEISRSELAQADAYEVSDYRRIRVTLASGMKAWVYADARTQT